MITGRRRHIAGSGAIAAVLLMTAPVAPLQAAVLPERITSDTVLTQAGSPWELQSHVLIDPGVTVTVEPDVRIIARGDFRLTVSGTLTAMSPMGTRIVFRATDNTPVGTWRGLYFTAGSTGTFQRVTFRNAADNIMADSADVRLYNCDLRLAARDGMYVWGDSFVKAAYCRFQNNGRYGLQLQTSQPQGAIIYSRFVGSGQHPVRVKATCLEMLRRGNVFEHNGVQAIGVDCAAADDIEDTDCWADQDLPLDLTVGSPNDELTIAPGGTLRIKSGMRIYAPQGIVAHGRLLVDGLPDARVVIQPRGDAQPGDWLGIKLEPGALARITAATIGFARTGLSVDDARLYMRDAVLRDCREDGIFAGGEAHVDLAGCTIDSCGGTGLHMPQPASTGKVRTTRIVGCGGWPARMAATAVEALRDGNSFAANAVQRIGVLCGSHPDILDDDAWLPQGVPYDLSADPNGTHLRIGSPARLSLRPGVQVVGGGISVAGVFVAHGEPAHPVTFGSAQSPPAPGDWSGIEFILNSSGRLVNTAVSHAESGVVVRSPGYIRFVDAQFTDCLEDGIRMGASAKPIISGCEITRNGRWGIAIFSDAQPALGSSAGPADNPGRNAIFGNGLYDLANQAAHAVVAQRNWWGTTDQARIARQILDHADDPSLGPVNFTPYLNARPAAAPPALASELQPQLAIMSALATPAGTGATISVALSRPAQVRAIVRNIAGRQVRELSASAQERSVLIPWDGRDLRGSACPSGRYLVEVEALADDGGRARMMIGLSLTR